MKLTGESLLLRLCFYESVKTVSPKCRSIIVLPSSRLTFFYFYTECSIGNLIANDGILVRMGSTQYLGESLLNLAL